MRHGLGLLLLSAALGCLPGEDAPAEAAPPAPTATVAAVAPEASAPAVPVDAWGVTEWPPPDPSPAPGPRLYSKARFVWIRPMPNSQAWLGYLSLGDSVRLKRTEVVALGRGPQCREWYEIEPKGFVCAGEDATVDAADPAVVALQRRAADRRSPWPYRYGESIGAPVYRDLPSADDQRRSELGLDAHLARVGADTTRAPPPALIELPPNGRSITRQVVQGSTVAYTDAFHDGGRGWLLTWDQAFIPKDKVRPYQESHFKGVILGAEGNLPIAFFRGKPRPRYRREGDRFVPAGQFPRLAWVELSGRTVDAGERYLETTSGDWCAERDAAVAAARPSPPLLGRRSGRKSWVDVSVHGGTLVAYEGERAVYATLISPGRGGTPFPGVPALETAATPVGNFTVTGKFLTATMVSSSVDTLVHAEVQYTQNFDGPYALHGAYWHDDWGQKKSAGCVNLSPIDSRRLFRWTEPPLPEGWHAMRTYEDFGDPTLVVIRP